ncbi:MAG: DUF1080 domain-containing protein [Opitutus sp.]
MNPKNSPLGSKTLFRWLPALILAATTAFAQPSAPANLAGGAGAAVAPMLTNAQQAAIVAMMQSLNPLAAAASTARNELIEAVFAVPRDETAIRARGDAMVTAELALASARAERFAGIQTSGARLSEAQVARLITQTSQPAAGRGGRGGPLVNPPSVGPEAARQADAIVPRPAAMSDLLTVAQQRVLDEIGRATPDPTAAAAAARQALVAASFATPRNDAEIRAKAIALSESEQALALARAEKFAALQGGPDAIPSELRASAIAHLSSAGARRGQAAPRSADDATGFVSIFDGQALTGWDGDSKFWRAENGAIVGESTAENPVTRNTFLIWRGGTLKDFELKTEFRMSGTNSGIQFRSREIPEVGQWVLGGYQADMDAGNTYTGGMAEERGRHNSMVRRGEMIRVTDNDEYKLLGVVADPDEIARSFVLNGWNTYHIIAKGNLIIQILNGRVSVIMIDEAEKARAMEGVLGLQMHVGPPFKIEFRNLLYRKL